jgi:hypothetical protein
LEAFKFVGLESRKSKRNSTLLFRKLRVLLARHYVLMMIVVVLARNGPGAGLARVLVVYVIGCIVS